MTIEHAQLTDGKHADGVLIRVEPAIRDKIAKALGYDPSDANIPGGWSYGLFPKALARVAATNPTPPGPSMTVYPTLAAQMRHALNKPIGDETPVPELVQEIIERIIGGKTTLKAAPATDIASIAASESGAQSVLALSGDALSMRGDDDRDRQLQLLREATRQMSQHAKVLILSADESAALALSGDRQAELLRKQVSDAAGDDDRQMQLLRRQVAGPVA